jgi:hypothetical protein
VSPAHRCPSLCKGLLFARLGGFRFVPPPPPGRGHQRTVLAVRGKQTVEACQVDPWLGHQGGQTPYQGAGITVRTSALMAEPAEVVTEIGPFIAAVTNVLTTSISSVTTETMGIFIPFMATWVPPGLVSKLLPNTKMLIGVPGRVCEPHRVYRSLFRG